MFIHCHALANPCYFYCTLQKEKKIMFKYDFGDFRHNVLKLDCFFKMTSSREEECQMHTKGGRNEKAARLCCTICLLKHLMQDDPFLSSAAINNGCVSSFIVYELSPLR